MALGTLMQAAADGVECEVEGKREKGMGVEIMGVGLEGIHPPILQAKEMAAAFHWLVESLVRREVDMLEAEKEVIMIESEAKIDATAKRLVAESGYARRVALEEAKAERFRVRNQAYRDAEKVFKARTFLAALEVALTGPAKPKRPDRDRKEDAEENKVPRKYLIAVKNLDLEHIRFELADPAGSDISDIGEFTAPIVSEAPSEEE